MLHFDHESKRDLALTACRTNEVARIVRRIAKQRDGEAYIQRIASDAGKLQEGRRERDFAGKKPVDKIRRVRLSTSS